MIKWIFSKFFLLSLSSFWIQSKRGPYLPLLVTPWYKQCYFIFLLHLQVGLWTSLLPLTQHHPMDLSSPAHTAPPCWHLYWAPRASPICTHHGPASLQPGWCWDALKEWDAAEGRSTPSTSVPDLTPLSRVSDAIQTVLCSSAHEPSPWNTGMPLIRAGKPQRLQPGCRNLSETWANGLLPPVAQYFPLPLFSPLQIKCFPIRKCCTSLLYSYFQMNWTKIKDSFKFNHYGKPFYCCF